MRDANRGHGPAEVEMSNKKKLEPLDEDLIRALAELLNETGLSEIEIEQKGIRVRVARNLSVAAALPSAPHPAQSIQSAQPGSSHNIDSHPGAVKSPMVGTAYRAPEPESPPFVEVGSSVKEGQTLLIIEAMKTMNHIPAPRSGTVTAILFENAQPVEYGEPLLIID